MKKYKESIYNQKLILENGDLLLSNALYNQNMKFLKDKAKMVIDILNECSSSYTGIYEEIYSLLKQRRFVIDYDFNEKSLVDYLRDEIIYSNDMLHLSLIPTEACNFRCKYCYQDGVKHFMSNDVIQSIKQFLKRNLRKYNGLYVSWYGGEPLLAKDTVLEIMRYANDKCKEYNIPLYGQITTNGYNLSLELFNELQSNHVLSYMVTIDGTKETHNYQRPHATDDDSYSKILNNLKAIKENVKRSNFRIGIRINISPNILSVLDDYVDLIGKEFGNDKRFGIIWEWVKDWGGERICSNFDLITESYESTEYKKYLSKITELGLQIDRGQSITRLGSEMCIASRKNGYLINYNGKVYKCAMALYDPEIEEINCIGEISKEGKLQIDPYKNSLWVGQGNIPNKCGECKHYPECMGLLCPLALKIRNIFNCPRILEKEQPFIMKNDDFLGKYKNFPE